MREKTRIKLTEGRCVHQYFR